MTDETNNTTPPEDDPFAESTADPFADDAGGSPAPAETPPPVPEPDHTPAEAPAAPTQADEQPPPPPAQETEVTAPPAEEIPTVDREGQPVTSGPLPTTEEDATAAAPEEPPTPAPQPTAADQGVEAAADQMAPVEAAEAPEAPAEEPTQPEETPPAAEPAAAPDAAPAPAPSNGGGDGSNGEGEESSKAKSIRHYVVLYATSPTGFEVAKLTNDNGSPKEEYVKKVDDGYYLEARNNEHAYKLAFHLMGSPRDGVTIWPVPKASYRPRKVAPAPPQPERERLVIS